MFTTPPRTHTPPSPHTQELAGTTLKLLACGGCVTDKLSIHTHIRSWMDSQTPQSGSMSPELCLPTLIKDLSARGTQPLYLTSSGTHTNSNTHTLLLQTEYHNLKMERAHLQHSYLSPEIYTHLSL